MPNTNNDYPRNAVTLVGKIAGHLRRCTIPGKSSSFGIFGNLAVSNDDSGIVECFPIYAEGTEAILLSELWHGRCVCIKGRLSNSNFRDEKGTLRNGIRVLVSEIRPSNDGEND